MSLMVLGFTVLIATGLAQRCVIDYDLTTCYVGSMAGFAAGGIAVAVGLIVSLRSRTTWASVIASGLVIVFGLAVTVLTFADPRLGNCYIGFHQPLMAPGQTPLPVPSLDQNGMHCD